MVGYILTIEQKDSIQGVEFASYECFNCVQDIDGVWFNFITEQQIQSVQVSDYAWVLNLPQGEYVAPPPPEFPA